MTVAGNSELTAGQMVNLIVPSRVIMDREPGDAYDLNENLSGAYIIKDVQHIFMNGVYTSIATLVRSNYAGK